MENNNFNDAILDLKF